MASDAYRQLLIRELATAVPVRRRIIEQELIHSREMDKRFLTIEENTLKGAAVLAAVVLIAAVILAILGQQWVAAIAVIADIGGTMTVLITRSYFIGQDE